MSWIISAGEVRRIRQQGKIIEAATSHLTGFPVAQKNELLPGQGINFNELPNCQKRGIGTLWEMYDKVGTNLLTGETVVTQRRRVRVKFDLPMKDEYSAWIRALIDQELVASA